LIVLLRNLFIKKKFYVADDIATIELWLCHSLVRYNSIQHYAVITFWQNIISCLIEEDEFYK